MEYISNVSQCPYMQSFVFLTDFGFLIAGLKPAFSQTGVVLAVTVMNIINECCRSLSSVSLEHLIF